MEIGQPVPPSHAAKSYFSSTSSYRYRRAAHVTPKSYLSFICMYKKIYSDKRGEIGDAASRMTSGLDKLEEASEAVERLKEELVVMERDLEVASHRAEEVKFI